MDAADYLNLTNFYFEQLGWIIFEFELEKKSNDICFAHI